MCCCFYLFEGLTGQTRDELDITEQIANPTKTNNKPIIVIYNHNADFCCEPETYPMNQPQRLHTTCYM